MPRQWVVIAATALVCGLAVLVLAGPGEANRPPGPSRGGPDSRPAREHADTPPLPGDPPPFRPQQRRPEPISDEQEQELLAALKEKRPEDHERLMKLKDGNPRMYRWVLSGAWRHYQEWKEYPPAIQEAIRVQQVSRVKSWRLIRAYRQLTDESQKAQVLAEIMQVLGEEFDADQAIREFRLNQLEERIKQIRADLKDRVQKRKQLIEESFQRLVSLEEPPGPPPPPPGPGPESRPRPSRGPAMSRPAE